jgi:hypothetical protein
MSIRDNKRFMSKVSIDPVSGCWNWTASKTHGGYGRWVIRKGKSMAAHRFAYIVNNGEVDVDLDMDHLCRNRGCVNPEHLEPVTRKENLYRGNTLTASRAAQTHCKRGHELAGDNLEILRNGTRRCKTCKHAQTLEYRRTPIGKARKAEYDRLRREKEKNDDSQRCEEDCN